MPNLAVVLGLDRYATDLSSLDGPVADAIAFARWLLSSGEVAASQLHLGLRPGVASPTVPEALSACQRVGTTLAELNELLVGIYRAKSAELGRLYFFFSGHGAASSNPFYAQEAICLEGFADDAWTNALELSSLLGMLNALPAQERFIFIDGCRNTAYTDEVQFGSLALRPRPDPGQRRNYMMRATGPGRRAAEVKGRGLFARHLCDGLAGAGSAKRWNPEEAGGDGGYVVRWGALAGYVSQRVDVHYAAQRHEQLIFVEGEHPAKDDPELARLAADLVAPCTVSVQLEQPDRPPEQTRVLLRRNETIDDDVSREMPATGCVQFEVAPSGWLLWAQAPGWRSKAKSLVVYDEKVEERILMLRYHAAIKPRSATDPSMFSFEGTVLAAENVAPELDAANDTGILRVRVAGRLLQEVRPSLRVTVRRESGETVTDPLEGSDMPLGQGAYRVRLESPAGLSMETATWVMPGEVEQVDFELPHSASEAMMPTMREWYESKSSADFSTTPDRLHLLAAPSLATVELLEAARDIGSGENCIEASRERSASGVEVWFVNAAECGVETSAGISDILVRGRLASMDGASVVKHFAAAYQMQVPIASAVVDASPGLFWLHVGELLDARCTSIRLATQVFHGHLTVVIHQRTGVDGMAVLQVAMPLTADRPPGSERALVEAEALQRAIARRRDPLVDPPLRALVRGDWFEPFSGLVAASALLERGEDAREMFDRLLGILALRPVHGPDLSVLLAAQAALEGDDLRADGLVRDVLDSGRTPLVAALLDRLHAETMRLDLRGEHVDRVSRKRDAMLGESLWTQCRSLDDGEAAVGADAPM